MRLLFSLISPEQIVIMPCQIEALEFSDQLSLVFSEDVTFKKNQADL